MKMDFDEELERILKPWPIQREKIEANTDYRAALQARDIIKIGETVHQITRGNIVSRKGLRNHNRGRRRLQKIDEDIKKMDS